MQTQLIQCYPNCGNLWIKTFWCWCIMLFFTHISLSLLNLGWGQAKYSFKNHLTQACDGGKFKKPQLEIEQAWEFQKFREMIHHKHVCTPCGNNEKKFRFPQQILAEIICKQW